MPRLPATAPEFLAAFKAQLLTVKSMDEVASLLERIPAEIARSELSAERFDLELAEGIAARDFCKWLGWSKPFGVSGDVHQRSFSVRLYLEELEDPYGRRIATEFPRVGDWIVDAKLEDRPPGPLPGISAGASPAYPLEKSAVAVVRLQVRWQPLP